MNKKVKWWSADRKETSYVHWTAGKPKNQVQLSFLNNWLTFKRIIDELGIKKKKCIELGCGRGNMSLYFANDGWSCTLLDNSPTVIKVAKKIFLERNLKANFCISDAIDIKLKEKFNVCFSIGLLEHIPELKKAIKSQINLLEKDGLFLMYVVPDNIPNVQKNWNWLNSFLKILKKSKENKPKPKVYRSNSSIKEYERILRDLRVYNLKASGIYPLPMISHSIDFPFSLNNKFIEFFLTNIFVVVLKIRKFFNTGNPWLCEEKFGQAFLVWGQKSD